MSNSDLRPELMPGVRVLVFDPRLFKNDVDTPLSITMKPATIVSRYGKYTYCSAYEGGRIRYNDLLDVVFDHRPNVVSGVFTSGARLIAKSDVFVVNKNDSFEKHESPIMERTDYYD
jgi:hypothetical protein